MQEFNGTYSPEDNKLRLYATSRLDRELYQRVSAAGFKYAPKQECFIAPMWTPARYDLLVELCGEVEDENKTLAERAEDRADRFTDYASHRNADAERARKAVHAIADNIPFGQPILVGHHSESRHRRDAARIDNGMRRAVDNWGKAEYWERRAQRALAHAEYKELPSVRARRIKTLEADMRKSERSRDEYTAKLAIWSQDTLTLDDAIAVAGAGFLRVPRKDGDAEHITENPSAYTVLTNMPSALYAIRTLAEIAEHAKAVYQRSINHSARWIEHYQNRIAFERSMLGAQGGFVTCSFDIQPGGSVYSRGQWLTVIRVTRKDGQPVSVSTNARLRRIRNIGEITDYKAPTESMAAAVATVTKLPPLCNYPGAGIAELTKAEWNKIPKDYRCMKKDSGSQTEGAHRARHAIGVYLRKGGADANLSHSYHQVFITDEKRKDPPPAPTAAP